MKTRIMYMENKSAQGLNAVGRIGRVRFSKTYKTIYYRDHVFHRLGGQGFKANYYDEVTGDEWWISGPHTDGDDRLYGGQRGVEIDEDVAEEYWREIRGMEPSKNL
ncbi:MAG TPA: hypothetical protein VNH11_35255 [Pirellulales bacterium]|nr:hypothetical protein [Pirellulales bacterium]